MWLFFGLLTNYYSRLDVDMPPSQHDQRDYSSADNRYLPRWEVSNTVECKVDNFKRVVKGQTKDLSIGGACVVVADDTITPRDRIRVVIQLSEKDSVDIFGHVAWIKPLGLQNEIGISFGPISQEAQDLIFDHAFEINREEFYGKWFEGFDGQGRSA